MIASAGVGSQAIVARTGFEIAYMGVLAPVAVIATGSFGWPPAARAVVVVVANTVPMEFCPSSSELRAGSRRTAAAAPAPPGSSASTAGLTASLALAAVVVRVVTPIRSLRERRPLLYGVVPAFLSFSVRKGGLSGHRPAGVLPQDAVHIVRHHPVTQDSLGPVSLYKLFRSPVIAVFFASSNWLLTLILPY